jgi:hypothetical protein
MLTVSEPEFRLLHMILAAIGCGVGMFVYGYMLETAASAILCSFFWGWMMFGVLIGGISPMSYGLDAFRDCSNELFMMNMLFKVVSLALPLFLSQSNSRTSCFTD